jgi:hypothetical protein
MKIDCMHIGVLFYCLMCHKSKMDAKAYEHNKMAIFVQGDENCRCVRYNENYLK